MNNINILDSTIYNRISAGEVVENPASVVKELVENSIDSGATSIAIDISGGGIDKIRISDNGSGIVFSDLTKAFLPHATSKISSTDDLESISTLGFRGEALASIAAVSKVKLISKPKEQQVGGLIEICGGEIKQNCETGSPDGTYITVENLFYNTPARKKFLKKPSREESLVTDLVSRIILSNPDIEIKYSIDRKDIFHSTGKGLQEAVFAVYKKEVLDNSFYHYQKIDEIEIFGYMGKFEYSKSNRSYQTLVVNGRVVSNATVSVCVNNAYSNYLLKHKFPFYILFIKFPYEKIDVNVHPRKAEIKFDDNNLVYNLVNNFIKECFNKNYFKTTAKQIIKEEQPLMNKTTFSNATNNVPFIKVDEVEFNENKQPSLDIDVYKKIFGGDKITSESSFKEEVIFSKKEELKFESPNSLSGFETAEQKIEKINSNIKHPVEDSNKQMIIPTIDKIEKRSRVIGQLFKTYILLECDENLLLIDQHAGHERLMYDKLSEQFQNNSINTQQLLIPYVFETNSLETMFIKENLKSFFDLGFTIIEFGNNCFKLETVPAILSDIELGTFVSLILSEMKMLNKQTVGEMFKEKLMQNACKSSIKAGQELTDFEIDSLLKKFNSETTLLCPHGRPIMIEIDKKSIEKWFKRIV